MTKTLFALAGAAGLVLAWSPALASPKAFETPEAAVAAVISALVSLVAISTAVASSVVVIPLNNAGPAASEVWIRRRVPSVNTSDINPLSPLVNSSSRPR